MAVTRADKVVELEQLEKAFKGSDSAILVDYKGMNVPQVTELRRQLRTAKASYKVVKNTIAKRALKGTSFEVLEKFFEGTTAVAYTSTDPVALAKTLTTFGKTSFAADSLVANAHALVESIVKAKPAAAKGKYLKSVTLSSTMGPGVRIDTTHIDVVVKH